MKIGIDIGGSHFGVAVVEKDKILVSKDGKITQEDKQQINKVLPKKLIVVMEEILKNIPKDNTSIETIGIASAGNIIDNCIYDSHNLGIKKLEIAEILQKRFKVPVNIRNDAECAAMAEKLYGNMRSYDNALFLCMGTGIGGRMYEQGKLLSRFGSVGHMIIQKDGIQCRCGKQGCFERYCSMKVLKQKIREKLKLEEYISGQEILTILQSDINKVEDVVSEYTSYLAIGIANLVNMLKPEVVCIGGSFSYYGPILLPRLEEQLQKENLLDPRVATTLITTARYQNNAGMIGAANLEIK